MLYDNREVIYEGNSQIKAGGHADLVFDTGFLGENPVENCRFKLRLRGRNGLHAAWLYEGGLPYLFRDIDDSLCEDTDHSRFSLKIAANGEDFPRRAYYKVQCPPAINSQYKVPASDDYVWKFSCLVRTEELAVLPEGCVEIRFERFLKKEGKDIRDIGAKPDETLILPIPQGTNGFTLLEQDIRIDDDTAVVLVTIAVEHVNGTVWLEDPVLKNKMNFNILPDFDLTNQYHPFLNWTGENLSSREWCSMQLVVNGKKMDAQELFQRCHSGSENEIYLPDGWIQNGENKIELWNVSDYFHAYPYVMACAEILWEVKKPVRIIWVPEYPVAGETFAVLIETVNPNTKVKITADEGIEEIEEVTFVEPGLQVLQMNAGSYGYHMNLTVTADGKSDTALIRRIVERQNDRVITGTGDSIYIPQKVREMEDFLCWYCGEQLGNLLTFRPVYRWCGTRSLNPAVWERLVSLMNDLKLHYCHMIDGRELPGTNANPTLEMMDGEYFIGNQGHERDGACYYWGQRKGAANDTFFEELTERVLQHPDFRYHVPVEYGKNDVYYCFHPVRPQNMKEAAEQFVTRFGMLLNGVKRHTGPSTLFKYWFQAGIEVGGAELMYGPQEVILSVLRGASFAYDREEFGAHLAVQWSTTPHDTPARYRRFWLALFVSYLQGCHTINTEEGLYRIEEDSAEFDRFSEPCRRHADVQREFLRFVETHSRQGRLMSPIALIHGAYDGWVCFTRQNVWAHEGDEWKFGAPEASWDLMRVFYPDAVLDAIYRHPCPDSPQGFYSRTPYGTVDVLPVEASVEKYAAYKYMAFLGYNAAERGQLEKLITYVNGGGQLLLGWCHLFTDINRNDAISGTPHPLDAADLLGVSWNGFLPSDNGLTLGDIEMENDVCVLEERNGVPFLLKRNLGNGCVYFVNAREYPAEESVSPVYKRILNEFGKAAVEENRKIGWMCGFDTVQTAAYDREDGIRVIYAINTDWWSEDEDAALTNLLLGDEKYTLQIPRNRITIAAIREEIAVITSDPEVDILDIVLDKTGFTVRIQGGEQAEFMLISPRSVISEEGIRIEAKLRFVLQEDLCGIKELRFDYC